MYMHIYIHTIHMHTERRAEEEETWTDGGRQLRMLVAPAHVSTRQHTSAYDSIRQHTSAYGSIRQHTAAYFAHTPSARRTFR
jgi:hypothetical protein